jgi:hypothetical protein
VAWRLSASGAFITGCAVSALGTGAVYPVNVIYLPGYTGVYLANSFSYLAFAVVLAPMPLTANRRDPRAALRLLGLAWSLAMLVGCAAGLVPDALAAALLFAAIAVFSVGECLYTPAFQTVLLEIAGEQDVGRYAALASMTWTTALLAAPTLGIALVQLPWPAAYWLALAPGGLAVAALSAGIGSSREAHHAHPAGEPG